MFIWNRILRFGILEYFGGEQCIGRRWKIGELSLATDVLKRPMGSLISFIGNNIARRPSLKLMHMLLQECLYADVFSKVGIV